MKKEITKEKFKEINERVGQERIEKHERQKNIPKEPIYKKWWFLMVVLFLLYYLGFYLIGFCLYLDDIQINNKYLFCNRKIGFLGFMGTIFYSVIPFIIWILMILRVRFLDKKTTGNVVLIIIGLLIFFPHKFFAHLIWVAFIIFGTAWLVKTIKEKKSKKPKETEPEKEDLENKD